MLEGESIDKAFFEMIWWWSFFINSPKKLLKWLFEKASEWILRESVYGFYKKNFEWIPNILDILHEKVFNGFHEKDFEEITHLLLVWICRFNMDKSGAEKKQFQEN